MDRHGEGVPPLNPSTVLRVSGPASPGKAPTGTPLRRRGITLTLTH